MSKLQEQYEELLGENYDILKENERLRAENAKLQAALKPFAELADWYDTEPDTQPAWDSDYQPTVGQIRAARAAYLGEKDD